MVVATAPITTPTNQEQNSRNDIHVSNEIFQYMNTATLANFIADLYCREIHNHDDEKYQESKNIISLVNALKSLENDTYFGLEHEIDNISNIAMEMYEYEVKEIDRIVWKIMAKEEDIITFDSYLQKAKEFLVENTCLKLLK